MKKVVCLMLLISTFVGAQQQFNVPFKLADMRVFEPVSDGAAYFNLSQQAQLINYVDQNPYVFTFHLSYVDAQNNTNPIVDIVNFMGYDNQPIFARAYDNSTGYFYIDAFYLYVQDDGIVSIPDANFKSILLATNPSNVNGILDTNGDGEIQLSEANAINTMNLDTNSASDNISDLTGIEFFRNLVNLGLSDNQFASFNEYCLSGMINLRQLGASNCNISSIYVNNLKNLRDLELQNNLLTTIDVSNLKNLTNFAPAANPLTSLNINNLVNLTSLKCYSNNLTSLDLSFFPKLALLQCGANQITTLDVSGNPELYFLECKINNLTTLNIKNGKIESTVNFQNNPNLAFICADDGQISSVQAQLNSLGMVSTVLNTYCSFTPSGNYNTITGNLIFDANNNGCDLNDSTASNIRVNITDGTNTGASFTNSAANYTFYTQTGNFTVSPVVENPSWFTFSPPTATIPFTNNNNNTVTQNFCTTANGVHSDVEMVIAPIIPARPGFDAVYKVVYKNKGNQTEDIFLNFNYDNTKLQYVSASTAPSSSGNGYLAWSVLNVLPFQSGSIELTLHVNTSTDTPPVAIGDVLPFTSFVDVSTDENWVDNAFTYNQTVVGSFDPNDIICMEGDLVAPSEIGKYLHYIINFENTGTADAENIVVKDIIDTTKYDVSSLQILNSSDPVTAKLTNNIAEFIFQNINLHSGGHGNILLKIKSKNTLVQGNMVSKQANIYFDYNAPIATDMADTTFQSLSNPDFPTDASISIYPNPTKDNINISSQFTIKSIQLYDVQGRLLQTKLVNENGVTFDISTQTAGVYFVKITSDKGIKVEKIVRE